MKVKDPNKPFVATFASKIFPVVGLEKDKYLSQATLNKLAPFVPAMDLNKHHDVLPIAFNAYVANRMNLNDDVVLSEDAINFQNSFIHKQINVEHDRNHVIGVTLRSGFSKFGSDDPLDDDDLIEYLEETGSYAPFNGVLGGLIWKVAARGISDYIEEASDPSSPFFSAISASWEVAFDEFCIVAFNDKNEKNIENGELIEDEEMILEMMGDLRAFGGSGMHKGRKIGRVIKGNILGVGIGLTENPAADVSGIETAKCGLTKKLEDNNSSKTAKSSNKTVNINKENNKKIMKINSLADITDENLKEASASQVTKFIESELEKASQDYDKEKKQIEKQVTEASDTIEQLKTENKDLKEKFEKTEKELGELRNQVLAKQAEDSFNERMSIVDEQFELSEAQRKVIFNKVKELDSDESWAAYLEDLKVFATPKSDKKVEKTEDTSSASSQETVDDAIDNGKTKKEAVASSGSNEPTLAERFAKMQVKVGKKEFGTK